MTPFPYVLLRVAGLPYSIMEQLSWENAATAAYLSAARDLDIQKQDLLAALESLIQSIEDYPAKFYLKILRSAIFSERRIKVKSFEYKGKYTKEFERCIQSIEQFASKRLNLKEHFAQFEAAYEREVLNTRAFLQRQSQQPVLRKGLQMASLSLLQRLDSYHKQDPAKVNKKVLQTERTLLQYLSRICTKTSPFSQFTPLSFWDFSNQLKCPSGSKVRLNNQLFQILRDTLTHYPPFYQTLGVRWNASARLRDQQWHYLLNTRNVESIQRMDDSPVLALIKQTIYTQKEGTFAKLRTKLLEQIETEASEMEAYLVNLIDYGILEWDWPISGLDPAWTDKWMERLKPLEDPLLQKTFQVLQSLKILIGRFAEGAEPARKAAMEAAYQLVKAFTGELFASVELPQFDADDTSSLKTIALRSFAIPKEQLFYEDVSLQLERDRAAGDFTKIAQEVDEFIKGVQPLYYKAERLKQELFFETNFSGRSIPLIDYYEAFYKADLVPPPPPEAKVIQHSLMLKHLLKKGKWENGQENFHIPNFQKEELLIAEQSNVHPSIASLLQLSPKGTPLKAFVDVVFMGYGKLWGRFLHLFPAGVRDALHVRNKQLQPQQQTWAENIDASVYNPNIHPPLLRSELQVPGGQQLLINDQQIPINDLAIRQRPASKKLQLWHVPSDQEVIVFDFGFETLVNRSPLYRLLTNFSFTLCSPDVLIKLLDQKIASKDDMGVEYWPRIGYGKYLILRRRGWGISRAVLPLKAKEEKESAYFIRIQQWRTKLGIPVRVFIKIIGDQSVENGKRSKGDHYKPQYIDFESPVFVQLFARLIPKVDKSSILKIEEMLPIAKGKMFVSEYLLEQDRQEG